MENYSMDHLLHFKESIKLLNTKLNKVINDFKFIIISEQVISDLVQESSNYLNINESPIIIVNQGYDYITNKNYYIIGFQKTIIIVEQSFLSAIHLLFSDIQTLNICFLSNSKDTFDQYLNVKYSEVLEDKEFNIEINNFNEELRNSLKNQSISYLWPIIQPCISGYLIKQGYAKMKNNRISNYFSYETKTFQIKEFDEKEFISLRLIGIGTLFKVGLFYHIDDEKIVAIKEPNQLDNEIKKLTDREINNYYKIRHPLLPKFYGKVKKSNYIVIEFINGRTLKNIKNMILTFNEKITIIFELMLSIEYLHSNNFIIRDLKPNNVMIDENKTAVLIDFDRMLNFDDLNSIKNYTFDLSSVYIAPEVNSGKFTFKCDIFSLGKIIFDILNDEIPNQNELIEIKLSEMNTTFEKCIDEDETKRPTISQLLNEFIIKFHEYIQIESLNEVFGEQLSRCFEKENDPETLFKIGCLYNNENSIIYNAEKAFHYLKIAADKNHSQAQFYVGSFYFEGKGVEKNINESIKYYELSAKQENVEALLRLGYIYRKGEGITKDPEKAKVYYKQAAKQNNAEAQAAMGNLYNYGEGVKKNFVKAVKYYELAAKQQNADAIFTLGYYYYTGRVFEINYNKAKEFYEESAKQNFAQAFNGLGILYIRGLGVQLDMKIGISYFEKAAEMGNENALINLGNIYTYGRGVKQDNEKGLAYYKRAVELGYSKVYNNIGDLYFLGVGVKQDFSEAKKYYEIAANKDNADAINVLGYLYQEGKGVEQDIYKAKEYFERAAQLGQTNAYNNLGNIYLNVNNTANDYLRAKEYFQRSSDQDNAYGSYLLGNMYFIGYEGIQQDYSKAKKFFEKSADEKFGPALYILGDIYFNGYGVEKDYRKAIEYYERAAQHRNNKASLKLGILYYYGRTVEQNYAKSKEYFIKSAKDNIYEAFYYLGQIYEKGKGTEIDIEESIKYYKKCAENQIETISIDYNKGTTHFKIQNEKFYHSNNNLGLIYLLKYNDTQLADFYLSKAGNNNFPFGKNNNGFLNYFDLNKYDKHMEKAFNMFDSASKDHFTISEFQLGYMKEEKEGISKSINNYKNVLKYENEKNGIDDEQLYASNNFIYCLTNLKLFLYYLSNPQPEVDQTSFLINALFRSLFCLLFTQNNSSYSFKFICGMKDNSIILLNLKEFFMNSPLNTNIGKNTLKNTWKNIEQNPKRKRIVVSIEPTDFDSFFINENFNYSTNYEVEKQIKSIFEGINENRNNIFNSLEIIDIESTGQIFIKDKIYKSPKSSMQNVEKIMISSDYDDVERYLVYPKCLNEILTQNLDKMKEEIEDIVKEMSKLLYRPPYYIIFGRCGDNNIKFKKPIKEINHCFIEGLELEIT